MYLCVCVPCLHCIEYKQEALEVLMSHSGAHQYVNQCSEVLQQLRQRDYIMFATSAEADETFLWFRNKKKRQEWSCCSCCAHTASQPPTRRHIDSRTCDAASDCGITDAAHSAADGVRFSQWDIDYTPPASDRQRLLGSRPLGPSLLPPHRQICAAGRTLSSTSSSLNTFKHVTTVS